MLSISLMNSLSPLSIILPSFFIKAPFISTNSCPASSLLVISSRVSSPSLTTTMSIYLRFIKSNALSSFKQLGPPNIIVLDGSLSFIFSANKRLISVVVQYIENPMTLGFSSNI